MQVKPDSAEPSLISIHMSRIDASVIPGVMLHSHPSRYWVEITFTHKLEMLPYILYSPEIKWRKWESNLNVALKSSNWSEKLKLFLLNVEHIFSVYFLKGDERIAHSSSFFIPVASSTIFLSPLETKSCWLELNKAGLQPEHRNSLAVISLCPTMWLCRLRLLPKQSLWQGHPGNSDSKSIFSIYCWHNVIPP